MMVVMVLWSLLWKMFEMDYVQWMWLKIVEDFVRGSVSGIG